MSNHKGTQSSWDGRIWKSFKYANMISEKSLLSEMYIQCRFDFNYSYWMSCVCKMSLQYMCVCVCVSVCLYVHAY